MLTFLLSLTLNLTAAQAMCEDHPNAAPSAKASISTATTRAVASAVVGEAKTYGKGVTSAEAPLSLADAMKRKDELLGKDVVVRAEVGQVCQQMGCWMVLKDNAQNMRVTFKDYSFTVPKDSATSMAVVQGKLVEKEISAAEARTMAKEEGKSKAEAAKIKAPLKKVAFESTGLTLTKL